MADCEPAQQKHAQNALEMSEAAPADAPARPGNEDTPNEGMVSVPREGYPHSGAFDAEGREPALRRSRERWSTMLIEINARGLDSEAGGPAAVESEVRRRLARFENRLTRVQLHIEDVNADRGGACDKRCLIELRPQGSAPIVVSDCASDVGPSIGGAITKATAALDSHFGKVDTRR